MVRRVRGKQGGHCRQKLRKHRQATTITARLQEFAVDEKVIIDIDSGIQDGSPHPRFQGIEGVVIDTRLFSRKERDEKTRRRDKEQIEAIKKEYRTKIINLKNLRAQELSKILYSSKAGSNVIDIETGEVLVEEGFLPVDGLEVRRNNVLMAFSLLLLLIGVSVALLGFRTRSGHQRKSEA